MDVGYQGLKRTTVLVCLVRMVALVSQGLMGKVYPESQGLMGTVGPESQGLMGMVSPESQGLMGRWVQSIGG